MSEEPGKTHVRERLEHIRETQQQTPPPRHRLIPPVLLDRVVLAASILGLLLVAGTIIGMIWNTVDQVFGFRFVATVLVSVATLCLFRLIYNGND